MKVVNEHDQDSFDPVDRVLGALDSVLDVVHDRFVRPLLIVTRWIAFGFLLFALTLVVLVAGTIGLIRFSDIFVFQGYVWLSYLVVGALFLLTGLIIWRFRRPVAARKS